MDDGGPGRASPPRPRSAKVGMRRGTVELAVASVVSVVSVSGEERTVVPHASLHAPCSNAARLRTAFRRHQRFVMWMTSLQGSVRSVPVKEDVRADWHAGKFEAARGRLHGGGRADRRNIADARCR